MNRISAVSLRSRLTPRRVLMAGFCVIVLATRVHVGFDRVRIHAPIPSQSTRDLSVAVPLPDLRRLAGAQAAIVLRLWAAEPTALRVTLDDRPIAQIAARPARETRVDASAIVVAGVEHRLTITGDRSGWQVTQVEIANVHGFSTRPLSFVIVPREGTHGRQIPPWLWPIAAIGLLALPRRHEWPPTAVGRVAHRVGSMLIALLFAVALILDLAMPYKIVLSLETFLLCVGVLYLDSFARGYDAVRPALKSELRRWGRFLPHALVGAALVWSLWQAYRPGAGLTALIMFGADFDGRSVPALRDVRHVIIPGSGYDGQFYAQLALDPWIRDAATVQALDNPGYRSRRILFPWVAFVLGLARPWAIVHVYAVLNVLSWFGLGWLLLRWLVPGDLRSTLAWIACMLSHGLLLSAHRALPDGPSVLLLALGVLAMEKSRPWIAAGILGLSGLGKETSLLGGSILVPQRAQSRSAFFGFVLRAVVSIAPLSLWLVYLWRMGLITGQAGLGAFGPPLLSYGENWAETLRDLREIGWVPSVGPNLLTLVAVTTQAASLLAWRRWGNPWWRLGAAYAALMPFLGPGVWSGAPVAAARVVLPMTVAFNVLLPKRRWFWPLWVCGNADVLVGLNGIEIPWLSG